MGVTDNQARAMVEFVASFATLSGAPPEKLEDLSDGVAIFEALSDFAPDFFDPTTIARHLGDNWVLKNSNLRRLVRNLQEYFYSIHKDAPDVFEQLDLQAIAKDQNKEQIALLFELLAAAAVTSERKGDYVNRIMTMSGELQVEFKAILQSSLKRLVDYVPEGDDEDDEDGEDGNEMVFGQGGEDEDDEEDGFGSGLGKKQLFPSSSGAPSLQMEEDLQEARQQVASLKSQLAMQQEDSDKAQEKLRVMVEDLQDRLVQRQDELIQVEEDLQKAVSELEETKSKLVEAEEEASRLADDLDVANDKALQLAKVEATLTVYKKKLEQVGGVTQQMRDAEDQSANYVKQIMELEAQVKKSAAAAKQAEQLQEQLKRLEKDLQTAQNQKASSASELQDLKNQLKSANSSKKAFEEELIELRAKLEVAEVQIIPAPQAAGGFGDALSKDQQDKLARLEVENEQLRQQMENLQISSTSEAKSVAPQPTTPMASAVPVPSEEVVALQDKIKQLESALAQKDAENKKIVSDKDKLEAYTKRTLAKFQDKYLVALQECKLKLKEKQDKIEALEQRGAAERTAQKREERLLSSTIYELGMAIMQSRLKER